MLDINVLLDSQQSNISMYLQSNYYGHLFALYLKLVRYNSIMQNEIFTYDFDLAYQTVLEYDFLILEIDSFVYKYILSIDHDRDGLQLYFNNLRTDLPLKDVIRPDIDKYLDILLTKELESLPCEQAELIRRYTKYPGHDVLVTKRNYDSKNMCVGRVTNVRDSSKKYHIHNSTTYFDHKYFGFKKNYNYDVRLLNSYEIFNSFKYNEINYTQDLDTIYLIEKYDLADVKLYYENKEK